MIWTKLLFTAVCFIAMTTTNADHGSRLRNLVGCHTGADCGRDTCCQEKYAAQYVQRRRIGRLPRRLRRYPGICIPMGRTGWKCHPHKGFAWSKPAGLVQLCPCTSICGAINQYDKFGRKGICTWG